MVTPSIKSKLPPAENALPGAGEQCNPGLGIAIDGEPDIGELGVGLGPDRVEIGCIENDLEHTFRGMSKSEMGEWRVAVFHAREPMRTTAPGGESACYGPSGPLSGALRMPRWSPRRQQMIEWIERTTGGRVIRSERQPRWRPAWFIDIERDGEILPVYFRGDRGSLDHGVYPLEHEQRVLEVLEAQGIAVPHVYGLCPEPRGIVMARVAGRANLLTVDDADERAPS